MRRNKQPTPVRRGATTVEFALVAPVLFLFVFAAIEFSRANLVVHTTRIAAVEGARRGIVPGATAAECEQLAREELAILGIDEATVSVDPNPIRREDDLVTVNVSVPTNAANGFAIPHFFLGRTISSSATLRRESPSFLYSPPPPPPPPPPRPRDDD